MEHMNVGWKKSGKREKEREREDSMCVVTMKYTFQKSVIVTMLIQRQTQCKTTRQEKTAVSLQNNSSLVPIQPAGCELMKSKPTQVSFYFSSADNGGARAGIKTHYDVIMAQ